MKKIFNIIKKHSWLTVALALGIVAVCAIYTLQRIAPFGNNSMLDVDFYHQYGPLLNELYDRVKQGESLLYSFNTGLGIPFFRNYLNYLSSPFNIILFLFKKEHIVMAYSVIIGLKVIVATCTMSFYLKKSFNRSGALAATFGLLYALSGYFCAYYWNIMWLDGIVFLPIIMYGINRIIDDKKPLTYILSLSIMLFANYFIAYMICIFSVFYFLGYFIYRSDFKIKNTLKTFILFGVSSILAAGLVSFMLLPLFYSLPSISATSGSFPTPESQFSVFNYIFNHISGVNRTVFASDMLTLPNVYPGLLTIASITFLFANKKINIKFKIICVITLLTFFFIFNISTFDYIMHAFHVPNDLPWRYSFLYVFVLVTIGYYSFSRIKDTSLINISISFAIVFLLIMLSTKFEFKNIDEKRAIFCMILVIVYYSLSLAIYMFKKPDYKILGVIMIAVVFETVMSININWNVDHDIKTFMLDKKPYQDLIKKCRKDDNGLYRIEKNDSLTLNDGAWYDYYGVSTFTSMAYESTAKNQRMLGIAGNNINSYYYKYYQTPVYNTMFNIKYLMGSYIKNKYYNVIKSNDTYNLIEYKYPSSIGYAVNKDIKKWKLRSYEAFNNQSNFIKLSTNVDGIYNKVQVKEVKDINILSDGFNENSNGMFSYSVSSGIKSFSLILDNPVEQNIYLYIGGDNINSFQVDGEYYSLTSDEYYIFDVGTKGLGNIKVDVNLRESQGGMLYFYAYSINENNFNKFYNKIVDGSLIVKEYDETYIKSEINVDSNKTVFTSISYDDGWEAIVDGKKVKTFKIADSYLGFDISKGKHKVILKYYPSKMKVGLIISLISFVIVLGYIIYDDRRRIKK